MTESHAEGETAIRLRRTFGVPREKVFRAWVEPTMLKEWFSPRPGITLPRAEIDFRVGGSYFLEMRTPEGQTYSVKGTYREIVEPERLSLTWIWVQPPPCGDGTTCDIRETILTLEFNEIGEGTELILTHDFNEVDEERSKHSRVWEGCLEGLDGYLSAQAR